MKQGIYLDYAAATPLDPRVLAAMEPFWSVRFHNPSADYRPAREAKVALDDARAQVAGILGAKPVEIIFTAGATEANNLAIHGIMRQFPEANLAISAVEHESVRLPAANYSCRTIPVDGRGTVDARSVGDYIDDQTVLVSIMYANNEVGSIQPIRRIAAELAAIRRQRQKEGNGRPLIFHSDGAQAANYLDLHVHRLGIDLLSLNGGKIYGPKQSGALYIASGVKVLPLIEGGGQERGLRSGTENIAGAVGFGCALQIASSTRSKEKLRVQKLRDQLENGIMQLGNTAMVNGSAKQRLPNNLHVTFPGRDNERLLMTLDQLGIYASAGSACSASSDEPSHVLSAMGIANDNIRASVRFSLGRQTDEAIITETLRQLKSLVA